MNCRFDYMQKKSMSYISETEFWKEWHRLIEGTGTHLKTHVTLTPGVERFGTIAIPIIYLQLYSTCNNGVIQHFSLYVPREFWRNLGTELWRNWLIIEGPTEHLWHTSTQRPRKRRRLREGLASWIKLFDISVHFRFCSSLVIFMTIKG